VRIARATAAFYPRIGIRLDDIRVGEPPRLTLGRVDLSAGLRPLLSRRIEDADVIVSQSRIELPLPFDLPETGAAPDAATGAAAAAAAPIELVSIRQIRLDEVTIASRGREITLSAISSLAGSSLSISSLTAESGDATISATGNVELEPQVRVNLEATANVLDFDDLLALSAAFASESSGRSGGTASSAELQAHVTAPRARTAGLDLAQFEANVRASGADIAVDPLKFDVFGGHFDGWIDGQFGKNLQLRVGAGINDLDMARLAEFGGSDGTITGRLRGSARLAASGPDFASVLAAARGTGDATISNGTIRHLDVVRTVVLFFGRPAADAPPATGERFDSISATFALASQSLRSDDLTLRSPDFDVLARGTLDLSTKAINARADLMLSESLSAQAGTDLARYTRSGNRVVLPATIGGTLSNIRVGIDAGAALKRGIQNEVERRLQDLFKRGNPF